MPQNPQPPFSHRQSRHLPQFRQATPEQFSLVELYDGILYFHRISSIKIKLIIQWQGEEMCLLSSLLTTVVLCCVK